MHRLVFRSAVVVIAGAAVLAGALAASAGATSSAPMFVQQASAHKSGVSSLAVTPASSVVLGDRLVVEVGVWSAAGATASSVTDSAGNNYVELLHYQASENTEMSVWSAPITAGGGTRPTITVKPTSTADVGVAALEYSGLSTVADATIADQIAHASGTTTGAATVSSPATPPSTAGNELALGLYLDSGFGDTLSAGTGYTARVNVSNTGDIELLAEDQTIGAGATPKATVGTSANTVWLAATIVLKNSGGTGAGNSLSLHRAVALRPPALHFATPARGRSGAHPHVHRRHRAQRRHGHRAAPGRRHHAGGHHPGAHHSGAHHPGAHPRSSLHQAARIAASAQRRFVYDALLKHLSPGLLCHHGASGVLGAGAVTRITPGWPDWWWSKPSVT